MPVLLDEIQLDTKLLAGNREVLGAILPICREYIRRKNHPYFRYSPDNHPERPQLAFHKSTAPIRIIFGGNQSGKSRSAAQEIAWWLTENHPWQETPVAPVIYVISASYRTVEQGIWRHLKDIIPEWLIEKVGPKVSGYEIPQFIRLRLGGIIYFFSAEGRESARQNLQAAECDLVAIDEEVGQEAWNELMARRLSQGGRVIVSATLIRSELWLLDLEDKAENSPGSGVDLFRFSTYRARDAGHVSASVVKEMEVLLSEEERDVRLRGKSRRSEGLVYPEFGREHIVEPHEIPSDWTRYMAIDPGFRCLAVLWAAIGPDGRYEIYREGYFISAKWREVADFIYHAEGWTQDAETGEWVRGQNAERIHGRYMDPAGFGCHEGGQLKLGQLLAQPPYKISCVPAQNDVLAGIEVCRRSLLKGLEGIPRMRVFRTCPNFIREIRRYRLKGDSGDGKMDAAPDRPVKRDDHVMDCWRYLELTGMQWRDRRDPTVNPEDADYTMPIVNFSQYKQAVLEEHWKSIQKRLREGAHPVSAPGGIGSEY